MTGIMPDDSSTTCWISFGGNVGDVRATFDAALALLSLHSQIGLCRRSGIYGTAPMGAQAGSPFLNSVCELTTQLSACDLLKILQSVETQLGRVRTICWGPRTLDLDLLSYGTSIVDEPLLVLPHPALTYRRFVLDPLVEVDPHWSHPACNTTAAQMLDRLHHRPLRVALTDIPPERHESLSAQLRAKFPETEIVPELEICGGVIPISMSSRPGRDGRAVVDLRRSPGDVFEKLSSALTAIFDAPIRVSDW